MSLPARQLNKLKEIEGGLTGSDPRLRSLFAIFARLTRGEAMPWFEECRSGRSAMRSPRPVPRAGGSPAGPPPGSGHCC